MASPVCIKLHNIKMVKIQYEGKLYEVATSSFENLLSDFQKHKPEVKQLLYARPLVEEDFENLTDESIVYASGDATSYTKTEGNLQNTEVYYAGLPQLEYRNTTQNGLSMSIIPTSSSQSHPPDATKLRSDLSMVDSYCSPPSVFIEAPPETEPIDTADVAKRVRDVLERHKISQTLFSKYVIKRSQGTTSDLLRCPKQWERMSEDGKVPYRRMKAWLEGDLQHNLQVLLRIKQGLDVPALPPKCNRTKFTDEQKEALELFLSQNPRLTHDTLEMFAREQNLTISAVRNWVNNRKQRMKRGSTGFEETPAKYSRIDNSDDLDDGHFETGSQEFDASGFNGIETENIPTMVTSAPYNQGGVVQTRQNSEFDASNFNGVDGSSIANVPTMVRAATTLKQEHDIQKQCEYNDSNKVIVEGLEND